MDNSILDLFNTKIFFRNTDPSTIEWISKVLREAECTEHVKNFSYGAKFRDGVTLAKHAHAQAFGGTGVGRDSCLLIQRIQIPV